MRENGILVDQAADAPASTSLARKTLRYDLLALLVAMVWGATFLGAKIALRFVGPFTYLFLCYLIGTLTLTLIFYRHVRRITRRELRIGLLIGLVLFAGYALQTTGMQWTSVSKTGFLTGLYVPLVPIFGLVLLRQRVAWTAWVGMLLSLLGLCLLSIDTRFTFSIGPGELLVLGCAVAFAWQLLLLGKFAPDLDSINLTIVQLALTAVLSFVAMLLSREPLVPPPAQAWLPIVLLGTIDMGFTLVCTNWILSHINSTRATMIYSSEPLWAAFFGVLFAGDVLSVAAWIGCACIFCGMLIGRMEDLSFKRWRKAA